MLRAAPLLLLLAGAAQAQSVDFADVAPILTERCVSCHSGLSAPMGLELTSYAAVLSGGWGGPVVSAGDAESDLLRRIKGADTPRMPLNGPPFLSDAEIALIESWVMAGLAEGEPVETPAQARAIPAPGEPVLWPDVEPVFQRSCIKCHSDNSKLGGPPEGLRLDSLDHVLAGGERLAVLPGNPEMSEVWRRIVGLASPRMPHDGPPWLSDTETRLIRDWIAQGAMDAQGARAEIPVGGRIRLRGTLTAKNEIDGAQFKIDGGTRIDDAPGIGGEAEMRGVVQADGSVRATRFRDR